MNSPAVGAIAPPFGFANRQSFPTYAGTFGKAQTEQLVAWAQAANPDDVINVGSIRISGSAANPTLAPDNWATPIWLMPYGGEVFKRFDESDGSVIPNGLSFSLKSRLGMRCTGASSGFNLCLDQAAYSIGLIESDGNNDPIGTVTEGIFVRGTAKLFPFTGDDSLITIMASMASQYGTSYLAITDPYNGFAASTNLGLWDLTSLDPSSVVNDYIKATGAYPIIEYAGDFRELIMPGPTTLATEPFCGMYNWHIEGDLYLSRIPILRCLVQP